MRTEAEVNDMLDLTEKCHDLTGMSYQEGVKATLEWVAGFSDEAPYTEDEIGESKC